MPPKRGRPPASRASKAPKLRDEDVAAALERAARGDADAVDDDTALALLCRAPGASSSSKRCARACKGNARKPDCVCGLVPPDGGHRKKGLWVKDERVLLEHLGADPAATRRDGGRPAGLKNLGNTCYVNAVLQCLFNAKTFRARVFALDAGDDSNSNSNSKTTATATGGGGGGGPVAHLRRLFALMQAGARRFADPSAFASSLALETGTQQDGQEFLKLLLAFLERRAAAEFPRMVAGSGSGGEDAAGSHPSGNGDPSTVTTFVQEHYRGLSTYATICGRCGRASEASSKPVDFYEIELNVGAVVGGVYVGQGGADASRATTLSDGLRAYLEEEKLEGENQFSCERCERKCDATRAARLHALPPYLNVSLKRFVFDFDTMTRKKVTDAFEFPSSVDLSEFVSPLEGDRGGGRADDDARAAYEYDLAFILVHRGQNATSGHYVALVKDANDASRDATWWRFDDDEVDELRGGPFGDVVAAAAKEKAKEKEKEKAVSAAASKPPKTPSKPKKGRDGSTLPDGTFSSKDAYLLVYRRRDASDCLPIDVDADASLPADLAAVVDADARELEAMIETHASRVEEERERLRGRRDVARAVAACASCVRGDGDGDEGAEGINHEDKDEEKNGEEGARADVASRTSRDPARDDEDYYFVPGAWLKEFCDAPTPPPPLELASIACEHGLLDPERASTRAKRVTAAAYGLLVAAAGVKPTGDGRFKPMRGGAAICRACLRRGAEKDADALTAERTRERIRDALERWTTTSTTTTTTPSTIALDGTGTGTGTGGEEDVTTLPTTFLVSKPWLTKWKAWRSGDAPAGLREGPCAGLRCPHGGLSPTAKSATVPGLVFEHLAETRGTYASAAAAEKSAPGSAPGSAPPGTASAFVPLSDVGAYFESNENKLDDDDDAVVVCDETGAPIDDVAGGGGGGAFAKVSDDVLSTTVDVEPFPVKTSVPCEVCAATRASNEDAASRRKDLAETHRNACAGLLHPADVLPSNFSESVGDADARFRVMPIEWLRRWRAFATGSGKASAADAKEEWTPSRSSLLDACAALTCRHALLLRSPPTLTRTTRGKWSQEPALDAKDAPPCELVRQDDFCVLEELLDGRVDAAPRATATASLAPGDGASPATATTMTLTTTPALCEECPLELERAAAAAAATYEGASVWVEKVKAPPPVSVAPVSAPAPATSRGRRAPSAKKEWWRANPDGTADTTAPTKSTGRGGVSVVVDASYTVWQLKLLVLERLGVHPLDQSLYFFSDGAEVGGGDDATTLARAGVTPEAKIALVARADHDADDLTGLEMPMPTPRDGDGDGEEEVWEDVTDGCADAATDAKAGGGKGARRGGVETPGAKIAAAASETRARERGFAGTGLHGND